MLKDQFEGIETPFYYYDMQLLENTLQAVKNANSNGFHVHYAVKANVNSKILNLIKSYGFGVDCVSAGEIALCLEHGFAPGQIVLAGVGKTDKEITYALEKGIFSFNVESMHELEVIEEIASGLNKVANISIRINPEIEAGTHKYITTGTKENKFGISTDEFLRSIDKIKSFEHINFIGLHYHIGSQITDLERFKALADKVNQIQDQLTQMGVSLPHLNVGGGLGINYEEPDTEPIPDFEGYFDIFNKYVNLLPGQQLHFELGRSIVGQCGSLISKVLYIKDGGHVRFAILDAGMTELIRPALYQAKHFIQNITSESSEKELYDVVGPICESSDSFGKQLELPVTKRGDLMMIRSAGAYGETMRSNYNSREFVAAYYSDELKK